MEAIEKPTVDLRKLVDLLHAVSLTERFADDENAGIRWLSKGCIDVGDDELFVFAEAVHALPYHTKSLLDCLLKGATDSHHLTDRLHATAELTRHAVELTEVPAWYLADAVV